MCVCMFCENIAPWTLAILSASAPRLSQQWKGGDRGRAVILSAIKGADSIGARCLIFGGSTLLLFLLPPRLTSSNRKFVPFVTCVIKQRETWLWSVPGTASDTESYFLLLSRSRFSQPSSESSPCFLSLVDLANAKFYIIQIQSFINIFFLFFCRSLWNPFDREEKKKSGGGSEKLDAENTQNFP